MHIDALKKSVHDYLRNFLRTVGLSDSLCQRINMRKRDRGYELQNRLHAKQSAHDIWARMVGFKDSQQLFTDVFGYLLELMDIFVQNCLELNADCTNKIR